MRNWVNPRPVDAVIKAARDFVLLWTHLKIRGLSRDERNAAIEDARERLIIAVRELGEWD